MENQLVLVLDFGGQYNQLIARRVRECGVYCEVIRYTTPLEEIAARKPVGIIFTGGPNSVYDEKSPHIAKEIFEMGIPILGICYGCQLMAYTLGGTVTTCTTSEYGKTETIYDKSSALFGSEELPEQAISWMSHTDYISEAPEGFTVTAHTENCPVAAMENPEKKLYAVQFHPEVNHTQYGLTMLDSFLKKVCGCTGDWKMDSFVENNVKALRERTDPGKSRRRQSSAGAVRRRRQLCLCCPAVPCGRQKADLHLRRPRFPAEERGRRGRGCLCGQGHQLHPCQRQGCLYGKAERRF